MLLQPGSTKQMYNPTEVNTFRGFLEVYRTMTIPMVRSHLGNLLSEKVLQLLDSFLDLRKIQRLSLAELKAQVDSKLSKEVNTVEDLLKSYLNSDVDIERNELLFLIHEVQVVLKSVPVQHFKGGSHKNLSFLIGVLDRMLVNEMRNQTSGLETKKTSGALEVNTKEEQLYVWRNDGVGKRFSEEGTLARLQRGVHSWREEILEKITPVKEAFQSEKLFGAGFGIVLIAKYFTKVFKKHELLNEKGQFSNKHHQYRALFFLKYLIYGRVSLKDDDLAIRLLLGITTDEVIRHKDLHADEKKDMEGLLSSVLHHWKGSGSTTVATLRSHFLQRKGGCYPEDKGYLWRVEKAPYDVLLKTLPWGYEQLFFQWLNFKIHVIW